MGANSSKVDSPEEEEFQSVLPKLFNVSNVKEIGNIDRNKLQAVWSGCLTSELISFWAAYLEDSSTEGKRGVDKESMYRFYSTLSRGGSSDAAALLCSLLDDRAAGPCQMFHLQRLTQYMSCLIDSLIKSLKTEEDESLRLWSSAGVGFNQSLEGSVIDFLVHDLKTNDKQVEIDKFEKWLMSCTFFLQLQSDVLNKAFCHFEKLGRNQKHLPHPDLSSVNKTRLDVHHVIYLNSCLPPESKHKWRLLFSSRYSGESWIIFLRSVVDQGPTLLIVWDRSGRCFGGYASMSWSPSPHFYGNDRCFLFTLIPDMDKFDATHYNKNFQYINTAQATFPNGLGMGGQLEYWGLYIDSSMRTGRVSASCSTFANYRPPTDDTFLLEDVEVWGLGDQPLPLQHSERKQRSVLDTQTEAKAVLEMIGKSRASEGLREPEPVQEDHHHEELITEVKGKFSLN